MNNYLVVVIYKGMEKGYAIKSDNEFSALNIIRNSYKYDKILRIEPVN